MDGPGKEEAGKVICHQSNKKDRSEYPDEILRFHVGEEIQHQRVKCNERQDRRFAEVAYDKQDEGCKNIDDLFSFRIPEKKMQTTEPAKKRQQLIPVFQAGYHLRMDRVCHKKQSDQEREEDVIILQQTF